MKRGAPVPRAPGHEAQPLRPLITEEAVDHQLDLLPGSLNLRTPCSTVDFRGSLYDRRFVRFLGALMEGYTEANGRVRRQPGALQLFALAGVREFLRREPAEAPGVTPVATAGATSVYRMEALPMVRRVARARFVSDEEAAWRAVTSGALDPSQEVVLEMDGSPSSGTSEPGSARVVAESQEWLEVDTEGPGAGWLVRAQTWAPGWRAWVDGREQPVRRADYLFQAVALPPGRHRVRLEYREPSLAQGAVTALLALAGCVLLAWRDRRSPGGPPRSPAPEEQAAADRGPLRTRV